MSGIVGMLRLHEQPCSSENEASFQRMLAATAPRGPDAVAFWRQGPVIFGHAMLRTTPESLSERQPLRDEAEQLCLTFDGRIDNRVQLRALVEAAGHHVRDDTDAELVIRAYAVWGSDAPSRLIGDFAFALWDGRRRSLFCARDPMGIKCLCYQFDGRTFRFASEPRAILADHAVRREPNEGTIGEFLSGSLHGTEETFFNGVMRLRPGHCLTIADGRVQTRRFWGLNSSPTLQYRANEDYAAHFLDLFIEAVRCRIRTHGSVGAELSGGLDSSSVACVAATIVRDARPRRTGLATFSMVFPGLACDESGYIADVVNHCGQESHLVRPLALPEACAARHASRQMDVPRFANDMMFDTLGTEVQRRGLRALLTGQGGDEFFSGLYHPYLDHVADLRLVDVGRQIRLDADRFGLTSVPALLYWHALRPVVRRGLPAGLIRIARRVLNRGAVPAWIDPRFAGRTGLRERLRSADVDGNGLSTWRRLLRERMQSGWQAFYSDSADQWAASFGFEYRHPFYDTRIVDFAWSLPAKQCWRRIDQKIIIPLAMRGLLPERLRQRSTKAEFSEIFVQALRTSGAIERKDFFHGLRVAAAGWVVPGQLRSMFDQMMHLHARGDETYTALVAPLWASIALEEWYSAAFTH
jgi:asparagine synthase (glutamine-hydrolysing)